VWQVDKYDATLKVVKKETGGEENEEY